jgi:23S rRNA pseudouridine955/2504/2580 synthase
MPLLPQSMMYKGFRKNCVKLNGRHIKDGKFFVNEGDCVQLYFRDEFFSPEPEFIYIKPKLDIVYEDENILIVNKEAGVVVHADEKGTKRTLIAMIQSYLFENNEYNPETENTFRPALCNRLDRNTSGILIVAKTYQAAREFGEALQKRTVRKFYRCIVKGEVKKAESIDGYLWKDEKTNKVKIFKDKKDGASEIHTAYRPVKSANGLTLLEVHLITGRTHQIRAHLSSIGHSILGDPKYGDKKLSEKWKVKYQLLHACRLELDGFTGEFSKYNGKIITADVPNTFTKIITED